MLAGFENLTYELTDYEKGLVPKFVKGFSTKRGKQNAITNKAIVAIMKARYNITEPRVRKIINYIRIKNLVPGLVASKKGYYISNNPEEVKLYIKSLDGRVNEIRRVRESMQGYLKKLVTGQMTELNFNQ